MQCYALLFLIATSYRHEATARLHSRIGGELISGTSQNPRIDLVREDLDLGPFRPERNRIVPVVQMPICDSKDFSLRFPACFSLCFRDWRPTRHRLPSHHVRWLCSSTQRLRAEPHTTCQRARLCLQRRRAAIFTTRGEELRRYSRALRALCVQPEINSRGIVAAGEIDSRAGQTYVIGGAIVLW